MESQDREKILSSDYLFKKHMLDMQVKQSGEIAEIKKEMSGMKIKIAGFASVFGLMGAYLKAKLSL